MKSGPRPWFPSHNGGLNLLSLLRHVTELRLLMVALLWAAAAFSWIRLSPKIFRLAFGCCYRYQPPHYLSVCLLCTWAC